MTDPARKDAADRQPPPERRTRPIVELRALDGKLDEPGTFEAIVAVFDNIDSYGDRILRGAFEATLKPPPEGRGFPPVVWSHDWQTPPIGPSLEAGEVDEGLRILGRLLVRDDEDHAVARQVYAAMRATGGDGLPPLREFSFGFRTRRAQWVEEDPDTLPPDLQWTGGDIRELLQLDLYEVGPCLVGANPATELIAVRAAAAAATGSASLANRAVRELANESPALRAAIADGTIPADAARSLFSTGDNPDDRTPSPEDGKAVRARIAEVDQLRPAITL